MGMIRSTNPVQRIRHMVRRGPLRVDGETATISRRERLGVRTVGVARGWQRLRFASPTGIVESISIVFDEGQDVSGGLDQFGLAVIDNIDVNGTLVGRGPAGGK